MLKTVNYNLNKPEVTDPLRLADFNENSDLIDGALGALNTTAQTLNTAVAGKGNCHIASGTYVGTGKYGSTNPTTIEVGFAPRLVIIYFEHFENQHCRLFTWPGMIYDLAQAFTSETVTPLWNDTSFGLYSASAYGQMNGSGYTYSYIAIG